LAEYKLVGGKAMSEERKNGGHLNRYKMFRNFLYNELGITKEDVMLWTKEAIQDEVKKLVGQIDVSSVVHDRVRKEVGDEVHTLLGRGELGRMLHEFGYDLRITREEKK
jgi:hypothetical protein